MAPAALAEPPSPQPVLTDCAGKGVSRPKAIQISCADGGIMVCDIRWTRWDMNGAKGTGIMVVNSCIYKGGPSCMEGQMMSYAATLSLDRPASGEGIGAHRIEAPVQRPRTRCGDQRQLSDRKPAPPLRPA